MQSVGSRAGMISSAEYREIAEAHAARRIPPWKTSLGGEIFIHGEMDERGGTAGCVAISDQAMEELFPQVDAWHSGVDRAVTGRGRGATLERRLHSLYSFAARCRSSETVQTVKRTLEEERS